MSGYVCTQVELRNFRSRAQAVFAWGLQRVGTKLQGVGTKLQRVGTKLQRVGTKLQRAGTKLQRVGTKLQRAGTKLLISSDIRLTCHMSHAIIHTRHDPDIIQT